MPEPLVYAQAIGVSAAAAALVVFPFGRLQGPASAACANVAGVLAITVGVVSGFLAMGLRPAWPPANGLDRLLTIILPAAIVIELVASFPRVPRVSAWCIRLALTIVTGRILLRGSVYLAGATPEWTAGQAVAILGACAALFIALWAILSRLADRAPSVSTPLALAMSIANTGLAIMLAGYIKGGSVALPIAAALAGTALATTRLAPQSVMAGAIGLGVVSLYGLSFIGVFFGRLSVASALALLLSPGLCWVTELPMLRGRSPRVVASVRLGVVAIPLLIVLALAALDFLRHTVPLIP